MQFTNSDIETLLMLRESYGIKNAVYDGIIDKLMEMRDKNRKQARDYWRRKNKLSSEKKVLDAEDSGC